MNTASSDRDRLALKSILPRLKHVRAPAVPRHARFCFLRDPRRSKKRQTTDKEKRSPQLAISRSCISSDVRLDDE